MILLFAHHLEPVHYPVLLGIVAAGFWSGWHLMSWLLTRLRPARTVS